MPNTPSTAASNCPDFPVDEAGEGHDIASFIVSTPQPLGRDTEDWMQDELESAAAPPPAPNTFMALGPMAAVTAEYDKLIAIVQGHRWSEPDLERVRQAYHFAREAHEGQCRKNGDPYIIHPVEVAQLLASMKADPETVMAALLHDVLEDTQATAAVMEKRFGAVVVRLVEGVTKLGRYRFSSKEEQNAENFRKMFLAMAQDLRVITLKLADRLHNMRTLHHLKPEKQVKIAAETMDIFAPLANRMGMGNIRAELEDLSLKYLHPDDYARIEAALADTRQEREATMAQVIAKIEAQLGSLAVESRIYGRVKNYYSIYKKMTRQQKELTDIFDISALRVVVGTEKECYEVLGVVHHTFTPVPGRFKDYIAMPKSNLYQSLHTTIFGTRGRAIEVQIRTSRMHEIAEFGIAAHFKYKEAGQSSSAVLTTEDQKMGWLRQMADMQNELASAQEFVDSVKLDFFPDQVFVFTPKGAVISLPKGSTPVDLAFRVHTEIGHHCAGAVVNERMVQLETELKNGDIVEIITNKRSTPRLDWVNFVKTQHAKTRIRQWYKKHYRDQHIQQGKAMLEAELNRGEVDRLIKGGKMLKAAKELNYLAEEDLYAAVGYGEMSLPRVLNLLKRPDELPPAFNEDGSKVNRTGRPTYDKDKPPSGPSAPAAQPMALKGLVYHVARCCMPVPGDAIQGIVTRSRGVMVHRDDCPNTANANLDRVMQLTWDGPIEMRQRQQPITLEVQVLDRIGVLKDILGPISDLGVNIDNTKCKRLPDTDCVIIEVSVAIKNLAQLETLIEHIKRVPDVLAVKRQNYRLNRM